MNIEAKSSISSLTEKDVLAQTREGLDQLKEQLLQQRDIEKRREWFGDYLRKNGINTKEFPRNSWLGKFLRTFRYYRDIKTIAQEKQIPFRTFFALKMIEGEGDPTNINTFDGGAGISQIQPDTFKWFSSTHMKKNYKVFSDNSQYEDFDYTKLMKQYNNRVKVNQIMAEKLLAIREKYAYNLDKLMALDDRFNPQIALDFSAAYLLYCKKQVNTKSLTDKSWDKYKHDPQFDFTWMLAFNGYNKWPTNFANNFEWSHMNNLRLRISQYDIYSQRLTDLLKAGYPYARIMSLLKEVNVSAKKSNTTNKKTMSNSYDPSGKNTAQLRYLNDSKDGQRYVYKYTIPAQNSATELQKIYRSFDKKNIQITDGDGNKLTRGTLPTAAGQSFFIKEKKKNI